MRAHPPEDGVLRGVETIVASGSRVRWTGAHGREGESVAAVQRLGEARLGEPRFEVWREALWGPAVTNVRVEESAAVADDGGQGEHAHAPMQPYRVVIDHPLSFAEAAYASMSSWWIRGGFALLVAALWWGGSSRHAAALALLLGTVRSLQPGWLLDSDPAQYHASALALLDGSWPNLLWPPAWPVGWALVGGGVVAGRVLGAGLIAATALACRDGRTALLVAVSAELIGFGPALYSDPLFVLAGVSLVIASAAPRALSWTAAALAGALAMLTRAHSLLVVPFVLRGRGRWLCLAIVGAWVAVVSVRAGHLVVISDSAGVNLWIGHGPGATGDWRDPGPEPAGGWLAATMSTIGEAPGAALTQCLRTSLRLWSFSTSDRSLATRPLPLPLLPFGGMVVLAAVGAARAWRRGFGPVDRVALRWLVLTTLATSLFFAPTRYKLALFPGLLPLASVAIGAGPVTRRA